MILDLGDAASELQQIEANLARRLRRERAAAMSDPETARRANRLAATHVGMRPGVVLALAEAGHEPDDPVAMQAATLSNRQRLRSPLGWLDKGDVVRGSQLAEQRRRVDNQSRFRASEREDVYWEQFRGPRPGTQVAPISDIRTGAEREFEANQARARRGELDEAEQRLLSAQTQTPELQMGGFGSPGPLIEGAEAVARTGAMVLNAPGQELQGQFRNLVSNFTSFDDPGQFIESQSDLGIAAERLAAGERVDVGSGIVPDPRSEVARERVRRERERGLIDGHVITLGRWSANLVTEPGSTEFNVLSGLVDAGVALKADPSAVVLKNLAAGKEARRLFVADPEGLLRAGGLRGRRPTTVADQVAHWLDTEGTKVIDYLADEDNFLTMWERTKGRIPVQTLTELVDARSSDEVRNILRPLLGVQIREKPELAAGVAERVHRGLNVTFGGGKGYVRLAETMPARRIDLGDLDDAVAQLDRFLRNGKVDIATIGGLTERMARTGGNRVYQYDVIKDAMDAVAGTVGGSKARSLTKMFVEQHEDVRRYFVNAIGKNVRIPGAIVDGTVVDDPKAHLIVEALGRYVPLPDARNIRSAMSFVGRVQEVPGIGGFLRAGSAGSHWVNQRWKEWALLRFAYPVRVIGEEQLRMAGAGLSSMFSHPASYLAYVVGQEGTRLSGTALGRAVGKGGGDVLGQPWDDVEMFRQSLNRGSAGWRDPAGVHRTKDWVTYGRNTDEYLPSWADELGELHADPVVRKVMDTADVADVKAWWWDGDGAPLRHMLAHRLPELVDRRVAGEYIDSVVERVAIKSGGDSRLLDAIRTGKLNGVRVSDDGATLNKKFVDELRPLFDEGVGPEKVKGVRRVALGETGMGDYDRFIEWSFGWLMSKPTNWLSRSKTFEQMYWKRMGELVPFMDEATQAATIGRARALNLDSFADDVPGLRRVLGNQSVVRQMEKRLGQGAGTLALEDADTVAKAWALDRTRYLLYDMAERNQFFDAMRLIVPFGDAWKEVLTRWGAIAKNNPVVLRRAQQAIQTARAEGWFYENEFGEEVFNYPGSEWATEQVTGIPIPLRGRVEGLSLATNVLPGVGPLVQISAGFFIDDDPEMDWLRDLIMPFGEFDVPTELRGWAPPWLEKMLTAWAPVGEMERMRASTTMDIATYLVSTGDYKITGPGAEDEIARLMGDAKSKARLFLMFRGAAQSALPSAPSPQMVVRDENGNVQVLSELRDHWQELMKSHDFDSRQAAGAFLDAYGSDLSLVMQGKSFGVIFGVPVTKEGEDWGRSHKGVKKKFPNVWGYFAPQEGEFDYDAYRRAMNEGARDTITPEQHVYLANARVASHLYEQRKAEVDEANRKVGRKAPTDEQREWLAQVKKDLVADFPGFERALNLRERATTDQQIEELERAAEVGELAETEAGQALNIYLDLRRQADAATPPGTSFQRAKSQRHLRDWLRAAAADLQEDFPAFRAMWERVFERELDDDLEER